ncbi:MAG: NAD-dependent protein deacylase [Oscillospiraceae bacterium]
MEDKVSRLQQLIDDSERIVFFGGAGVSTESGIPDFRSADGLYNQKYDYPPETILSGDFFERRPQEFYRFYRDKLVIKGAKPNAAHKYLAELEKRGKLTAVITQNIDGLHQAAGSENVLELHGTLLKNYCVRCGRRFDGDFVQNASDVPRCHCGGIVRPDIVLYGEMLDNRTLTRAVEHIRKADMLIVGGTSLAVYPAAGLVDYYRGSRLVLINKSPTQLDGKADLLIADSIGKVFSELR